MNQRDGLKWHDGFNLGHAPMDETHQEFVEIVNAILVCPDEDVLRYIDSFAAHAEAHFAQELQWMTESDFPSTSCHADEHEAVLKSVSEVAGLIRNGHDPALGRRLAASLADWFPNHADYLDSALAQWLVKKRTNGVPLVFRRKPGAEIAQPPV